MKKSHKISTTVALLTLILMMGSGCKKLLNINQSLNNPPVETGTPRIVLPDAILATTAKVGGDLAILGGIWSEYYTQAPLASQYRDLVQYNIPNTDFNDTYTVLYSSGLKNYQYVINKAQAEGDWNYYLMATVMKAYTVEVLVDLYDQIPYSEALQGEANLNPKFEDGHTIYDSLLNSIDTALSKDFNASTNTNPGSTDLIFGGNMQNWIAFANTLKLKMYLRMVNKYPDEAKAGIEALYNSNAPFLTTDAVVTNFTDQDSKRNPMYEQNIKQLNISSNLRASTTFVSWLKVHNDPRIVNFFGSSNITSCGQGYDLTNNDTYNNAAVFAESYNDPVEFISAAESYFMQAEANLRYGVGPSAADSYNQGVTAAFNNLGLDASSFIAAGGAYAYPSSGNFNDQLQAIITQLWASCAYGCHGIEGFFQKNRTGYPLTSPVYSDNVNYVPGQIVVSYSSVLAKGTLPQRLVFPYRVTSTNTNAPADVPITTPVWWAKQ
jgi:hypothetical protein